MKQRIPVRAVNPLLAAGVLSVASLATTVHAEPSYAVSSQTTVNQQVTGGSLQLSSNATTNMSAIATNNTAQISTGSLGAVNVIDSRGLGLGWSATATVSNFFYVNTPTKIAGINNGVTVGGTYSGATAGVYTVTVTTTGAPGVAQFSVSGLETATGVVTGNNVAIGTKGVTASFGALAYAVGDSWTIRVDVIPLTGMTMTPSAITTNSGAPSGVIAGSAHTFTSTNDPATLMSAIITAGMGSYTNTPALSLIVPANTYANNYSAVITETVN